MSDGGQRERTIFMKATCPLVTVDCEVENKGESASEERLKATDADVAA